MTKPTPNDREIELSEEYGGPFTCHDLARDIAACRAECESAAYQRAIAEVCALLRDPGAPFPADLTQEELNRVAFLIEKKLGKGASEMDINRKGGTDAE